MSAVRLRPMAAGDLGEIARAEEEIFGASAWSPAMLAEELTGPGRHYLVAETVDPNARIVGYGGVACQDVADIMNIAVRADERRRGVGRRLLRALLDIAAEQGCDQVFLDVRVDNDAAVELYRAHGFVPVGLRRRYYQPEDVDALVMRRTAAAVGPVGSETFDTTPPPGFGAGRLSRQEE